MKMKIYLLSSLIISLVIVSGCANIPNQYYLKAPDGRTPQQDAIDQIACQEESTKISSSGTRLNTNNYYDCLKNRGYILVSQWSEVPLLGDAILSIESKVDKVFQ